MDLFLQYMYTRQIVIDRLNINSFYVLIYACLFSCSS